MTITVRGKAKKTEHPKKTKSQSYKTREKSRKKLYDISKDADLIIKGLWLGNEDSAKSQSFLKKNNITVIINATMGVPHKFQRNGIKYVRVPVEDSLKVSDINKLTAYLPYVVQTVRKYHKTQRKNVLVHCHAGMQRSAAIVASYLMQYYGYEPTKAIKYVISKRSIAFLHGESINFEKSMKVFYANLKRFDVI